MDADRRRGLEAVAALRPHYEEIVHRAQIALALYGPVSFFALVGAPYAEYMALLRKTLALCDEADQELLKGFTSPLE